MVHLEAAHVLFRSLRRSKIRASGISKVWVSLNSRKVTGIRGESMQTKGTRVVEALSIRLDHSGTPQAARALVALNEKIRSQCPNVRIHESNHEGRSDRPNIKPGVCFFILYSRTHPALANGTLASA